MRDIRGGIDAKGNIVATDYTTFSPSTSAINIVQQQIGVAVPAESLATPESHGIAGAAYNIPYRRSTVKSLPLFDNYFKTSAMRAVLGCQTAWVVRAAHR